MDRTPDKIAKIISEDVRTNNGFLFEADDETPPTVDRENVPSPKSGNVDPRISDLAFRDLAKKTGESPIGGSERDNPAAQIFIHAEALIERFVSIDRDFERILNAGHPLDKRYHPAVERHVKSILAIVDNLDNLVEKGSRTVPWYVSPLGDALKAAIRPVQYSLRQYATLVGYTLRSEVGNMTALRETRRGLYDSIYPARRQLRQMAEDSNKGHEVKIPEPVEESRSRSRSNNISEGSMGLKKQTRRAKALNDTLTRLEELLRQSKESSGNWSTKPGISEYQTALIHAIDEIRAEMGRASISGSIKNASSSRRTTDYMRGELMHGRPGYIQNVDRASANLAQANAAQDILRRGGGWHSGDRDRDYQGDSVDHTIRAEYAKRGRVAPTSGGNPILP